MDFKSGKDSRQKTFITDPAARARTARSRTIASWLPDADEIARRAKKAS